MRKHKFSELNKLQVGRYGEYATKMIFTRYGIDVYTSEVDDKAIDFIVRKDGEYYDIQVKMVRQLGSVYLQKHVFTIRDNLLVVLVSLNEENEHDFYLIPSTVWENPKGSFGSKDYEREGLTSKPEWEIKFIKKYLPELEAYRFEKMLPIVFGRDVETA